MFTIRMHQLEALSQAALSDFEERMFAHLKREFPKQCRRLGDARLREEVGWGVSRARGWGLEIEYDICLYLQVMMVLGARFDEDPAHAFARDLLADRAMRPSTRIETLHDSVFPAEEGG